MRIKTQLYRLAAGMALGVLTACGGGGGDISPVSNSLTTATIADTYKIDGVFYVNSASATKSGHIKIADDGTISTCHINEIVKCSGTVTPSADAKTATVQFTGNDGAAPDSAGAVSINVSGTLANDYSFTSTSVSGVIVGKGNITGNFTGGKEPRAIYAGNYAVHASVKNSDGTSANVDGSFVLSTYGTVRSCSVGQLTHCIGKLTMSADKQSASFDIAADDGATPVVVSGHLTGSINGSTFQFSNGQLSGTDSGPPAVTFTGAFTGGQQQ
jgi:hypothetical protein